MFREDNNDYLATVGKSYKIIQNDDFFYGLEKEFASIPALKNYELEEYTDRNGAIAFRDYRFSDSVIPLPRGTKSDIHFRIIARNSYGIAGLALIAGAIDFYCTNGCINGIYNVENVRHTSHADLSLEYAKNRALEANQDFEAAGERWTRYAETPLSVDKADKYLEESKALSKPATDYIQFQLRKEVRDRGENLWALYSAITHYATHKEPRNPDTAFTSFIERLDRTRGIIENEDEFLALAA